MAKVIDRNFDSFNSKNLRLSNYFVAFKATDANGNFSKIWVPIGFSGGDTVLEPQVEEMNLRGLAAPQVDLDYLIKYLGYNITINLVEADIHKIALFYFNQNVYRYNANNNIDENLQIPSADWGNLPEELGEPAGTKGYVLPLIPAGAKDSANHKITPNIFTFTDSSSTPIDLAPHVEVKYKNGVYYIKALSTFPASTTFPYNLTISRRQEAQALETAMLNAPQNISGIFKLVIVGRNVAGGDNRLISVYIPKAKLTKPANIEFKSEDYVKPSLTFKTLLDYPSGVFPTDSNIPMNYMKIHEWLDSSVDTNDILAYYNEITTLNMNQ